MKLNQTGMFSGTNARALRPTLNCAFSRTCFSTATNMYTVIQPRMHALGICKKSNAHYNMYITYICSYTCSRFVRSRATLGLQVKESLPFCTRTVCTFVSIPLHALRTRLHCAANTHASCDRASPYRRTSLLTTMASTRRAAAKAEQRNALVFGRRVRT